MMTCARGPGMERTAGQRRGGWTGREGAGATWPTVRQRVVILGGFLDGEK
jgi:hypothetical protein